MFWVYVYLTDVDITCGPHQVLKGSGDYRKIQERLPNGRGFNVQDFFHQYGYQIPHFLLAEIFTDTHTFTGKAGATCLTNGFNFHRIFYPLEKPRAMLAARFSIAPPRLPDAVRISDPIPFSFIEGRVKRSEIMRHVTGNIFEWD